MAKKQATAAPQAAPMGSTMSRYISFVMLVITIVVCGFYFYNVIKGFLLPLFLAVLLSVMFRPFHQFVRRQCGERNALAAAISTLAIMLIVLVPLAGLLALGLYEGNQVFREREQYIAKANEIRASLGLQKPFAQPLDRIETELRRLDVAFSEGLETDGIASLLAKSEAAIHADTRVLKASARDAAREMWSDLQKADGRWTTLVEQYRQRSRETASRSAYPSSSLLRRDVVEELVKGKEFDLHDALKAIAVHNLQTELIAEAGPGPIGPEFAATNRLPEKRALGYLVERSLEQPELGFLPLVNAFDALIAQWSQPETNASQYAQHQAVTNAQVEYDELRTGLFRGPLWKWAMELLNPSNQQVNEWLAQALAGGATRWLPSITNTATSLIVGLLVGLGIMAVALFYFFLDGPKMINSFMHLSPLDDRHELELLVEFDKVSRAVVLATLLSALAQGVLGGIGYRLVGIESVFLLTLLTTVLALIPFVGAAAIWFPCCLYLAFVQESTAPDGSRVWLYGKAVFLLVYGAGVISMADNIIKPWVLQGQSKLHPLLALLSVLGGVQALGPIGILVGPMVVAFLQVLLTILQREITSLDAEMTQSAGE